MKPQSKRLFINNLPAAITRADLEQNFSHYGTVDSVEIKQRKTIGVNQTTHFAYVHLGIEHNDLADCLNEINNTKWKGHWINVQEAKESFMDRLKREREESKFNGVPKPKTPVASVPIFAEDVQIKSIQPIHVNVKKYHSSSSESGSDDDDLGFVSGSSKQADVLQNGSLGPENNVDCLVIKSNKSATIDRGLKIESVHKQPVNSMETEEKKVGARESEADRKRLQSIAQMKKGYQQQKSAIKNALLNIDSKPKNKIIFDDDIETRPAKKAKHEGPKGTEHNKILKNKKDGLTLFEDEDNENDDHEYNFEHKEHFEGEKGQKLMELQSKFKHDKRFAMDARFLEDQPNEELNDQEQQDENAEISLEQEKQKEFDILEQVLGKKVSRKPKNKEVVDSKKHKMMLRFDPSQPEHSKYEIKEPIQQEKSKKKKRQDSDRNTEAKGEEAPKPEVSKDTFYKVAVDLKSSLQVNEGFSLANMFSKDIEIEETHDEQTEPAAKKKKTVTHDQNPFRYDSSSDDDDETTNKTTEAPATVPPVEKSKPTRFWSESFFFKDDDYRLQEGLDFIKRLEGDDQGDFLKLRRNLKEIVRAKVRNNQRRDRPFKKKLGGKKRIRVKRAMKR